MCQFGGSFEGAAWLFVDVEAHPEVGRCMAWTAAADHEVQQQGQVNFQESSVSQKSWQSVHRPGWKQCQWLSQSRSRSQHKLAHTHSHSLSCVPGVSQQPELTTMLHDANRALSATTHPLQAEQGGTKSHRAPGGLTQAAAEGTLLPPLLPRLSNAAATTTTPASAASRVSPTTKSLGTKYRT